jgi:hypothetical protein
MNSSTSFRDRQYPDLSLSSRHEALLLASGIAPNVATMRGYKTVTVKSELERYGFSRSQQHVPALLIPVWAVATGKIVTYHLRPDTPRYSPKRRREIKYELRYGDHMAFDVHPLIREQVRDPKFPLFITEGVRKADAAISKGMCCVALLGTWNFRGRNTAGGKAVLADFEFLALEGREVYIVYDSDVMVNPSVHQALARLGAILS